MKNDLENIISVTPIERVFSITWNISIRCNYDCMYCPDTLHDNKSKHHSLEDLKKSWLSVYDKSKNRNLKYKISFTGGEPTTSKNFLPFLTWLREHYNQSLDKILLTTNGSASINYYKRLYDLVDNISFSLHSEHIVESIFFQKIVALAKYIDSSKFIHVNIMNEYWNSDRIKLYQDFLHKHNISHNVNEIHYGNKTREYPILKGKLDFDFVQSSIL